MMQPADSTSCHGICLVVINRIAIKIALTAILSCVTAAFIRANSTAADANLGADPRPRIIVCTDIGGTDFDDFQSMVHLLVYADRFDIEGLLSSPCGSSGRIAQMLRVIDAYSRDYPNLKSYSDLYPTPDALRAVTKQGALTAVGLKGFGQPTEGSKQIIQCARRNDPRPLWILIWGGIDDVAQALHDDPSIESKLHVYFIGGPNKKWAAPAYDFIAREHPNLWMIEDNSSYYGWFVGGDQSGQWGNDAFVARHIVGHGALGDFFANLHFGKARPSIKMGDTPSVAFLLGKTPEDPTQPSWGGQFVRAWDRPRYTFHNAQVSPPSAADQVQTYGIVEILYHPATASPSDAKAAIVVDKQEFAGYAADASVWHFIYCPKQAKTWSYRIKSTFPALNGQTGGFTSVDPTPADAAKPSANYPNWWTDNPDPALADGGHQGARTVNRWRVDYLTDFAARMERCLVPAGKN